MGSVGFVIILSHLDGVAVAHRHTERDYQTQGFGLDIVIIMSIITKYC